MGLKRRPATPDDALRQAVRGGDVEAARRAIERGADPRCTTSRGVFAYHDTPMIVLAAYRNDVAMIELLLSHFVSVNQQVVEWHTYPGSDDPVPFDGGTPLEWAVEEGHVEAAEYLLSMGANPREGTPVIRAVEYGHQALLEMLYAAGANLNEVNGDRRTPLYTAAHRDRFEMLVWLHERGARFNPHSKYDLKDAKEHVAKRGSRQMKDWFHRRPTKTLLPP